MNEHDRTTGSAVATGKQTEVAVLAGGCFWSVEDILRDVPGVIDTDVGYTGGWLENPSAGPQRARVSRAAWRLLASVDLSELLMARCAWASARIPLA